MWAFSVFPLLLFQLCIGYCKYKEKLKLNRLCFVFGDGKPLPRSTGLFLLRKIQDNLDESFAYFNSNWFLRAICLYHYSVCAPGCTQGRACVWCAVSIVICYLSVLVIVGIQERSPPGWVS